MKSYGMKGDMNPQSKQKANFEQGSSKGDKSQKYPGKGKGAHDMSPKLKVAKEEAIWQNMR